MNHQAISRIAKAYVCPGSLTGANISLSIWYLLTEGDNWLFTQRTFTADNYYAGYDQLIVGSNIKLAQGQVIARTKLDVGDLFVLKWNELVDPDKTPYIKAHHITESDFDPSDPTGYKEIIVKRIYRAEGSLKVVTRTKYLIG
jgi:hypothetical protein